MTDRRQKQRRKGGRPPIPPVRSSILKHSLNEAIGERDLFLQCARDLQQNKWELLMGLRKALSYLDSFLDGRAPEGWTHAEAEQIERLHVLAFQSDSSSPGTAGTGASVAPITKRDAATSPRPR